MRYLTLIFLFLFFGKSIAQPANNNCANATSLPVGTNCINGTMVGSGTQAGQIINAANHCGSANFTQTVWYSFTATETEMYINVDNISLSGGGGGWFPGRFTTMVFNTNGCFPGTGNVIDCDTHADGLTNLVANNLTVGNTYLIQIGYNASNGSQQVSFCINVNSEPPNFCADVQPFCSDSPITFPAATNTTSPPGPAYGCLITQPNPAWFYLEIADAGNLDITLTPNPSRDIDFILWGPFATVDEGCQGGITSAGNIEDCSFLAQHVEIANITNAQPGEIYILLITNFSNQPTNISVTQTGGTGSTNCAIVLPIVLSRFEVESKSNEFNLISWQTLSERDNDYFTLEHSKDGFIWNIIDQQKGAGTTSSTNNYSFTHKDFSNGINYYRLSQTDFDGEFETFNTISVENKLNLKLVKTLNMYGQEVNEHYKGLVFEYYNDGSTVKVIR